ncbi:PIN domain-containing protein [Pseudomonas sp. WOUb67]|uniref:PIN domain-containing protein n=1 Tax=Pseudomonas sp. WOUb67 TaxID=3161136 RepID=UPI003CF675C8
MKGLFPQYDYSGSIDHAETWKTAMFVFDTNALLNLYRYRERTREELLEALEKLSDRIWIPHHVALEFQRNRLTVIAAQGRRFSEIRKVIDKAKSDLTNSINNLQLKKRHTLIDPEPLIIGFETLTADFLQELDTLQQNQQTLNTPDPIKNRVEEIFDGRVGPAFSSQDELERHNKAADLRYKSKIPPGYMDKEKDRNEPDDFFHNGLIYKKKYGDYILWSQILAYSAERKPQKLIFITDDAKEDWWNLVELDGPKTIGPRAELIEEALRVGNLDTFLMYRPEGFLKFAKEFLAAEVSDDTLREVRDVSLENKKNKSIMYDSSDPKSSIYLAVASWILDTYNMLEDRSGECPDFIANDGDKNHGFIVQIIRRTSSNEITRAIEKAIHASSISTLDTITVVFIVETAMEAQQIQEFIVSKKIITSQNNLLINISQVTSKRGSPFLAPYLYCNYNDIPLF